MNEPASIPPPWMIEDLQKDKKPVTERPVVHIPLPPK
jgi:hypothetical protein